jgi:hypothetical protein
MDPGFLELAIAVVSLAVFAAAYTVALLATKPAYPRPGPSTPDLGEEPPAVVNLLANGWRINEDAAESTLLDLAAKRAIELRQPANDPRETTVHLRESQPTQLTGLEQMVLGRVRGLAVEGMVPLTALTFRNKSRAKSWASSFRKSVVTDARERGLSRPRFGARIKAALIGVAAVSAAGLAFAALLNFLRVPTDDEGGDPVGALWVGVIAFLVLSGIASAQRGERDTPAGQAAASRWLGVRAWLRGHEEFADLPPAAVMVWDRYLPYGAALGVTHVASQVLDLGMGDRRLVWSSYGDQWRRVRVRYPRLWSRYAKTTWGLLWPALAWLGLGVLVLSVPDLADIWRDLSIPTVALVAAGLLFARSLYRAVRALVDLATVRTITGQVLWLELWRNKTEGSGDNQRRVPWLYHLAVDDGTADRTTAWILEVGLSGRCEDGDTVRIRVRPWTRRVVELTRLEQGRAYRVPAVEEAARAMPAPAPAPAPVPPVAALLSAEEVGQALGMPVRGPEVLDVPPIGPKIAAATFRVADRRKLALHLQVVEGFMTNLAWHKRGTGLPGIGDDAYQDGDRATARVGERVLVLTLVSAGKGRNAQLAWLLQQAASRLRTEAHPQPEAAPPPPVSTV